ncbi:hypothetical protein LPJ75_006068 [Coemansia sp. RSA 2598]|nr:hypothetical protein LPJ75_006068 [Coemansia sp. RSA 2598]
MVTLAKRNSVFYRRPKSTTREQPAIEEEADLCSLQSRETDGPSAGASDKGYVPSDNDDNDDDDNGSGHGQAAADGDNNNDTSNLDLDTVDSCKRNDVGLGVNSGDEGLTREQQSELALRLALCRELPYWCCHFTADTREFLYSHQPYGAERPATEPAPPMVFSSSPSDFYPPTPEIVDSMVEYLMLMFHINTCSAVIPMERRLPDIREFIWRLLDGTMIDLWTAIACVILLRRYYRIQNHCVDAPYGAAHSLFLGIFMLASTQCVYTNNPELISLPSIVGILDSHYQVDDLVRIRREVFANIHYRTWISEEDIRSHAKNNLFDIYRVKSAYSFYKERQEQRMMIKEEERRQEVRRQNLVARLERFMHRTPHDSLGSWNTKTMYCTESRFLFRHLPWFPGMVTPIHVTARSEQAKLYNYPDKFPPVFSPLLPPTRSRITGTTN